MTSGQRFEQDLPELLARTGRPSVPDYRDDIVRQTAAMRQRPAWTFPERWLPMSAVTSRANVVPRVPWRILAVATLLVLALVGALVVAGSRPHVVAPFGPAANGLVAYAINGDIHTVDPVTGADAVAASGPGDDINPVFSRDGQKMAFEHRVSAEINQGSLVVSNVDGSGPVSLMPDPMPGISYYSFSPDGKEIAFTAGADGMKDLWIAKVDGSGLSKVDVGMPVQEPSWRPPDGKEIVFGSPPPLGGDGGGTGIYAVDPQTGTVRTVVAREAGVGRDVVAVSPDGLRIAYSRSDVAVQNDLEKGHNTYQVHVVALDGSSDVTLPMPAGAVFQDTPVWSNDGTRLAITRGYADRNQDMTLAIVPVNGTGVGIETKHQITGCCGNQLDWSPADTSILFVPIGLESGNPAQQLLVDPSTGTTTRAPWTTTSPPAWQRRLP